MPRLLHHISVRYLCRAFDCRILAKMHVATTPTWREPKQKRGKRPRTISIQIYIARNDCAEVTQARG